MDVRVGEFEIPARQDLSAVYRSLPPSQVKGVTFVSFEHVIPAAPQDRQLIGPATVLDEADQASQVLHSPG